MLVAHRNAVFDGVETEVDTCVPHPVVNNSNLFVYTCTNMYHVNAQQKTILFSQTVIGTDKSACTNKDTKI